jgi:hypothetical protein
MVTTPRADGPKNAIEGNLPCPCANEPEEMIPASSAMQSMDGLSSPRPIGEDVHELSMAAWTTTSPCASRLEKRMSASSAVEVMDGTSGVADWWLESSNRTIVMHPSATVKFNL